MPDSARQNLLDTLIKPSVRAMQAYHVADASGMVKLDAMENPYTWPESLRDEWLAELKTIDVNRYPDAQAPELVKQIKQNWQIDTNPDIELILGNGSDELIQILMLALADKVQTVMSFAPTFVMYDVISRFTHLRYESVALTDQFEIDLPQTLQAIERIQPGLLFIAHPNNPTGNQFSLEAIRAIIQACPGLVVIDEAYYPFAEHTFLTELSNYPNVVLLRTVSKLGLAGLRLGMLLGHPDWIKEFNKVRLPYNINVLTQHAAFFAMRHAEVFDRQCQAICADRGVLIEALRLIPGLQIFPSQANFILLRTPTDQANAIFQTLKDSGVLIKNLSPNGGLLRDCLRVTVGTQDQNQRMLDALKIALGS